MIIDWKLGDLSGDGNIQAYDASLVAQAIAGKANLSEIQKWAGDVDGDGQLTQNDVQLILQYSAGLITKFPAKYQTYAEYVQATGAPVSTAPPPPPAGLPPTGGAATTPPNVGYQQPTAGTTPPGSSSLPPSSPPMTPASPMQPSCDTIGETGTTVCQPTAYTGGGGAPTPAPTSAQPAPAETTAPQPSTTPQTTTPAPIIAGLPDWLMIVLIVGVLVALLYSRKRRG